LRFSLVDSFLVEVALSGLQWSSSVHVMLCHKFTAPLRTPQGQSVRLSAARALAQLWTYE